MSRRKPLTSLSITKSNSTESGSASRNTGRVRKASLDEPSYAVVLPPDEGKLYHGVFASDDEPSPGRECEAKWHTEDRVREYLEHARPDLTEDERGLGWYLFGNDWTKEHCRRFPTETCQWIWNLPNDGTNTMPYIYLNTISTDRRFEPDPSYNLNDIVEGKYDYELRKWARGAREFGHPVMVAWGSECNGYWRSWNGMFNGIDQKSQDDKSKFEGPERFVEAYRHIYTVMEEEGAYNINWIFEVVGHDNPDTSPKSDQDDKPNWNAFENYYPGNDYITWVGVSIYGKQFGEKIPPAKEEEYSFKLQFEHFYDRLKAMKDAGRMASDKQLIISEFGSCAATSENPDPSQDQQAANWAKAALDEIFSGKASGKYPDLIGFNWWNETWDNGEPEPRTEMRIQKIHALASVFATKLCEQKEMLTERVYTANS